MALIDTILQKGYSSYQKNYLIKMEPNINGASQKWHLTKTASYKNGISRKQHVTKLASQNLHYWFSEILPTPY